MFTFHINYEILGDVYTKGINVQADSLSDLETKLRAQNIDLNKIIYIYRKTA